MQQDPANVVYIVADSDLTAPWFRYTTNLLGEMLGRDTGIKVGNAASIPDGVPVIYYGITPQTEKAVYIKRQNSFNTDTMHVVTLETLEKRTDDIFVYADEQPLQDSGPVTFCDFDLLFNLFAYASCLEEWREEVKSGPAHSYALRISGEKRRFDRPYAELLVAALRLKLVRIWPDSIKLLDTKPTLFLTHDVDLIRKTVMSRLKEGVFRGVNAIRQLFAGEINKALSTFKSALRMLFCHADYQGISLIASTEAEHGARSVFNIFPSPELKLKHWLVGLIFDPGYDLTRERTLPGQLEDLAKKGWEIGAHFGFTNLV